jgi:hypothetical protein
MVSDLKSSEQVARVFDKGGWLVGAASSLFFELRNNLALIVLFNVEESGAAVP